MQSFKAFLKRKNIVFSLQRYGIDGWAPWRRACSARCSSAPSSKRWAAVPFLLTDIGAYAMAVSGPAMAVAIGYALQAPPMVLFSLAAVGWAANARGRRGRPAGRAADRHCRRGIRQGGLQGDEGGHLWSRPR